MSDVRHLADIFSFGFDDVDVLCEALTAAAPFRHVIMHLRAFTPANSMALRVALVVLGKRLADMLASLPPEDQADDDSEMTGGKLRVLRRTPMRRANLAARLTGVGVIDHPAQSGASEVLIDSENGEVTGF